MDWMAELKEAFMVLSAAMAGINIHHKKYGWAAFMALLTLVLAMKYYR